MNTWQHHEHGLAIGESPTGKQPDWSLFVVCKKHGPGCLGLFITKEDWKNLPKTENRGGARANWQRPRIKGKFASAEQTGAGE